MSLEDFIITVFCWVDEHWNALLGEHRLVKQVFEAAMRLQAPWVNDISAGLPVADIETTHQVMTALRRKQEGDRDVVPHRCRQGVGPPRQAERENLAHYIIILHSLPSTNPTFPHHISPPRSSEQYSCISNLR